MGKHRINNIFDQITTDENLMSAYLKARRNKRMSYATLKFTEDLGGNLLKLQAEIRDGSYTPGRFRTFKIYEPKERVIRAPPFRDRVAQHALINVVGSYLMHGFYYHSYACVKGKGGHLASDVLSRKYHELYTLWGGEVWVLKADIHHYFDSIDHGVLKTQLRRIIKDKDVLRLCDLYIDNNGKDVPVGIPVGNLTSQIFANVYLTDLDRYLKEQLRVPYVYRYMDDFVCLFRTRAETEKCLEQTEIFLRERLKLELNPKTRIYKILHGVDFVGYRHYPDHKRVRKDSIERMNRRIRRYRMRGDMTAQQLLASFTSWSGHAGHADSAHLIQTMTQKVISAISERTI